MKIPSDSSANISSTRSGVLRALGLRPGQSFTAQVTANSPDGLTQLKIGSQLISLNLPSKPQIGVMLQFLFQSGGKNPQIALMGELDQNGKLIQPNQHQNISKEPKPTITNQTIVKSPTPPNTAQQNIATTPASTLADSPTRPSSTYSAQQPNQQQVWQTIQPPNTQASSTQPISQTVSNIPLSPAIQAKLQLLPGQIISAKVTGQSQNGQTNFTIAQQNFTAPIAGNPPIGSNLQFLVHGEAGRVSLQLNETINILTSQAQAKPTEQIAQTGYGNIGTKTPPLSHNPQNKEIIQNIQPQNITNPTASSATSPISQAISTAIPAALARQDSIGALFANLMNLQKQNIKLDQNVKKATQSLINGQIKLDGKSLNGEALKQAIRKSGLFLESLLAGKSQNSLSQISGAQSDIKSLLLLLRSTLIKYLGEQPKQLNLNNRPPPPLKGALPRALPPNSPQLPDGSNAKTIARTLLSQTDSALSRLRLFQISSLPETIGRSPTSSEINLELPFSYGGESNIIRFQISKDREGNKEKNEDVWSLRFAMNLQELGEVGANISFRQGKIGVIIWAQEEKIAKQLDSLLPELTDSLEALGIKTSFVRVRYGAEETSKKSSGDLVNDLL